MHVNAHTHINWMYKEYERRLTSSAEKKWLSKFVTQFSIHHYLNKPDY